MSNGVIWALLGAAIATGIAGIGSIKGVGMAGGNRHGRHVGGFLQVR